jgi:Spy/CpxP family protein refolding chaperone
MAMSKNKIILLVSYLVIFAAGAASGLLIPKPEYRPHGRSWLEQELNLTPAQREQMRKIWSQHIVTDEMDNRKALAMERDEAVRELLNAEQLPKYEQILKEHDRKMAELSQERTEAFQKAVEQTRKILTPEQAKKYEELMKRSRERGGHFSGRSRMHPEDANREGPPPPPPF